MNENEGSVSGFETIHLDDVKRMLGLTGRGYRTVLLWCKKNKVVVLGSGKRRRIFERDWVRVNLADYIKSIKTLFPEDWENELAKQGLNIKRYFSEIESLLDYVPQSKLAKNFRKRLNDG